MKKFKALVLILLILVLVPVRILAVSLEIIPVKSQGGFNWAFVIIFLLLAGYLLIAYLWFKSRKKFKQLSLLGNSVVKYGKCISAALQDGKISAKEKRELQDEFDIVSERWKIFLKFKSNASIK